MTLLSLCQDACDELGIERPSQIVGSTDQTARTLLVLANAEGRALSRYPKNGWAIQQREHTFSTVASTAEYALPSDFRCFIDETAWDRDSYWEMRGPLSPQEWQRVKSGLAATPALRRRWRVKRSGSSIANKFFIDPTPDSVAALVFEYVSNQWLTNAAGDTGYESWQADTDVPILDSELMRRGLVWRFKAAKKFDFTSELAEYEALRDQAVAQDGGAPVLHTARRRVGLPYPNVPDSGFGS